MAFASRPIQKYSRTDLNALYTELDAWLSGTGERPYWNNDVFTFLLLDLLRDARQVIVSQDARLAALEARVTTLEGG